MKKLLYFLFLIVAGINVQAQPHLRVSNISGAPFSPPDTAYEVNTYNNILITVVNEDSLPFNDSLKILIQANSQPLDTLYSDSIPITIPAHDSVVLIKNGYVFADAHFDDGDNIIVVWPQAVQTPIIVDTLITNVHYVSLISDVQKIENDLITVYPNPSHGFISFRSSEGISIKQVRIYDSSGKIIYRNSTVQKLISTDSWSPGMYVIEVEKGDGVIVRYKLLKN